MKPSSAAAAVLLAIMFVLMFASAWNDSAIMDELPHIPAGYSYLTQKDMRINPEHPPLAKDLAAYPLLFLDINFPADHPAWTTGLNDQWNFGRVFFYESGNNPDQIIHWARTPMMALTFLTGWLLFGWARKRYGPATALLTLFFFAFSPTVIAHGRYVTTDLAATFGFLIGILSFVNFIENPTRKNLVVAGIAFGIAQLLKFSLFLLLPVYGAMTLVWLAANYNQHSLRYAFILLGKLALIGTIGIILIWLLYAYHIWNYPAERQLADATEILGTFGRRNVVAADLWLIQHPITRPLGQYMLGLLMVVQRAAGGNTTYFLGEVYNQGWWYYFPAVYLMKEPLMFHIFTLLALGIVLKNLLRKKSFALGQWIRDHFAEATMLFFITFYWAYSIKSPLNIGVRHVLPTFPFLYLLVSKTLIGWVRRVEEPNPQTAFAWLKNLYYLYIEAIPKYLIIFALSLWLALSTLLAFPHYVSYVNGFVLGENHGYRYVVDSNFDWGQDLKRLRDYVEKNNIDRIAVDYFGGGSISYYLGERAEPWWSARGAPHGYFAVSATFRQGAFGAPIRGFARKPEDSYLWLRDYEPIDRAGESIFIYKLP